MAEPNNPSPRPAVVISFDRWHTGFIGPYGNDWVETPTWNRIAARGVVFDTHLGVDFRQMRGPSPWWTARTPAEFAPLLNLGAVSAASVDVWERIGAAGIRTLLLREELAEHGEPPFSEVEIASGLDGTDATEKETPWSKLVERAVTRLQDDLTSAHGPWLLWLHSRGVPQPPLPPQEFVDLYFEEFGLTEEALEAAEDDEDRFTDELLVGASPDEPRRKAGSDDIDAQLTLRYTRAWYAACSSFLDRWLGKLLRTIDALPVAPLVIIVAGAGDDLENEAASGFLHSGTVQAPLAIIDPRMQPPGWHSSRLTQSTDVLPTLLDWFGLEGADTDGESLLGVPTGNELPERTQALVISDSTVGLRTPNWYALFARPESDDPEAEVMLFHKPDDRWDLDDVAGESPALIDELDEFQERVSGT